MIAVEDGPDDDVRDPESNEVERDRGMAAGRRAHGDEARALRPDHVREVGVGATSVRRRELFGDGGNGIDHADDLDVRKARQDPGVSLGDPPAPDDGGAERRIRRGAAGVRRGSGSQGSRSVLAIRGAGA